MKCPNDGSVLTMSERSGVEIDYCPDCRGVWLDRGERDKILDRVAAETPAAPPAAPPAAQPSYQEPTHQESYRPDSQNRAQGYRKPKRKEHWLSELFD